MDDTSVPVGRPVDASGLPVGEPLGAWRPPQHPPQRRLEGTHVTLEPLEPQSHSGPLHDTLRDAAPALWTYMPFGPFQTAGDLQTLLESLGRRPDWQLYTTMVANRPLGFLAYLRIKPDGGVLEIGSIVHGPALQRSTASTEAVALLLANAFELGYRRCEWKCDALNTPSRRAAKRLGFRYEGTFRKATHYKGRNRDTAWYAIVDDDWPAIASTLRRWLDAANFDETGRQRQSLTAMRTEPS